MNVAKVQAENIPWSKYQPKEGDNCLTSNVTYGGFGGRTSQASEGALLV